MRSFVGRVLPFALIALVAGCGDLTGPGDLSAARRLWESQNISSYEYVLEQVCFCIGPEEPVVVTVIDDVVVSIVEQDSGAPVQNIGWSTIDELFTYAEWARANNRLIAIEYDQDEGYPTRIETCCLENDSGGRLFITEVRPIHSVSI